MRLTLERTDDDGISTLGKMFIDGEFECWTLEDTHQDEKVPGETRIPTGVYKIKFRTEGGWNNRNKAEGFDLGVLHLQDVPGFTYILIHWGNYPSNTDGCILVGESHGDADGTHAVWNSKAAYRTFYRKVSQALLCETVMIEVTG